MEALAAATSVIALVELAAKIGSLCLQYSKAVKNSSTEISRLQEEIARLENVTKQVHDMLEKPEGRELKQSESLDRVLKQSHTQLKELDQKLQSNPTKTWRTAFTHALKWPFQRVEVEGLVGTIRGYNETISHILQVHQTNLLHKLWLKTILDTLPTANGASFDSHDESRNAVCLPGTRMELINDIKKWASDASSESLFWLKGMAGTGKSTISRTICRSFEECGQLGASFFFKRGEGDRGNLSRFVTTLAAQLTEKYPDFAQNINTAIGDDKSIVRKGPEDQFKKLIEEPLGKIPHGPHKGPSIVFVIDALDECDNDDDIELIIRLFSSCAKVANPNMKPKWLITSRPELHIRLGFGAISGKFQDLVLHDKSPNSIERDIATFLKHELERIKTRYNGSVPSNRQLPPDWPGNNRIQILVSMAIPLFIFAATTCRFLADRRYGHPGRRLDEVLRLHTESQVSQLDATYLPVLNRLIHGLSDDNQMAVTERFRQIVGPIVIAATPLSTDALAQLLGIPKDIINTQLDLLHSVLEVPTANHLPVRLLHLSFRDFLVDPGKRGKSPFWIDEAEVHFELAMNCLYIMNERLKQDICQLVLPGTKCADIKDETIQNHIPSELQYACCHWVKHVDRSEIIIDDRSEVLPFLEEHLLHWLEAMSLLGRAWHCPRDLRSLKMILEPEGSETLEALLEDASHFIQRDLSTITKTPLQLYSSLLAFAPKNSLVRRIFEQDIPKWMMLKPQTDNEWLQKQETLERHNDKVFSVVFSPDGKLVASASMDLKVRLWRTNDGTCARELKGHTAYVFSLAFSPDSRLVATASIDRTVRLWRSEDGTCVQELQGQGIIISSLVFSLDSKLIASASIDKIVSVCRTGDGTCVRKVERYTNTLKFDTLGAFLLTDQGPIALSDQPLNDEIDFPPPVEISCEFSSISEGRWILWKETPFLRIPARFRDEYPSVNGSTVVLRGRDGGVTIMKFGDLEFMRPAIESVILEQDT